MQFFTATINSWKTLLYDDKIKDIIVHSLNWFHLNKKAAVHAFVIMPNHIHLLWTALNNNHAWKNEEALIKFTAHEFKKYLLKNDEDRLNEFISTQSDREYHFWERRSKTIDIESRKIAEQKLDYIHDNPLQEKWKLTETPEDYYYSSAKYYLLNENEFSFLEHYAEYI